MNLQHLTDAQLINDTKKFVKTERETSLIILHHLREIHRRRLFSDLHFASMFHYCVKGLGYSESQTHRRLKAAKLLAARPDLEEKIAKGQTSIATMAQVQTHFDRERTSPEQKTLIINKTLHLSKRECEKMLLELSNVNVPTKREHTKRESAKHSRLSLNVSDELMKKLDRIRNILGHKDVYTYEKLLEVMANDILKRHDQPPKKEAKELTHSLFPGVATERKHIPAKVKRTIYAKADHRCEKCGSAHALQIDHRVPVCHGGGSELSNLRILCRACNQREAIKKIGSEQMQFYLQ